MSIGFFIAGGIIFATYMGLTLWNIYDSSQKSKKENYPNKK
jgi:CHASE3 domain sensor protein